MYQKRKDSRNKERDQLLVAEYQKGETLQEVGNKFALSRQRVHQILQKSGIDTTRKITDLFPKEMLEDLYITQKLSITQIAKKFSTSFPRVHRHLKKYDITPRSNVEQRLFANPRTFDVAEFYHLYVEKNYSRKQMAEHFGRSIKSIDKHLYKLRILKKTS